MALTISNIVHHGLKDASVKLADCAFDSSYPTGGEALAPSALGMARFERVIAENKSGYLFEYDYTNEKLLAYYADNDGASDGALIQVADTTDLSAVTGVKLTVIGY